MDSGSVSKWLGIGVSVVVLLGAVWGLLMASNNKLLLQINKEREPLREEVTKVREDVGGLTGRMDVALEQLQSLQANYAAMNASLTTLAHDMGVMNGDRSPEFVRRHTTFVLSVDEPTMRFVGLVESLLDAGVTWESITKATGFDESQFQFLKEQLKARHNE